MKRYQVTRMAKGGSLAGGVRLRQLSITQSSFTQGTAAGTTIGAITNRTAGSTLTIVSPTDNTLSLVSQDSGTYYALKVGSVAAPAGAIFLTIRETVTNPLHNTTVSKDSVIEITVNPAQQQSSSLTTLTLSKASFTVGSVAGTTIGSIQNKTNGSTIDIFPADGRIAIDSNNNLVVGLTVASQGTFNITLRETLAGATGSPKSTSFTITVTGVGTAVSYDLKINNITELRSANLKNAAIAAGKGVGQTLVVALAPGNYFRSGIETDAWFITDTYAYANGADVLFTGLYQDPNQLPVIDVIRWQGPINTRVRFQYVWICCKVWEPFNSAYATRGARINGDGSRSANLNGAFRFQNLSGKCPWFEEGVKFTGNYRGDHTHYYDCSDVLVSDDGINKVYENRYPECAQFVPSLGPNGEITSLTINASIHGGGKIVHYARFVGDNCDPSMIDSNTGMISDGEHPLWMNPGSAGTGFEGYMITQNGRVTGFRIANGGSGYTTAGLIIQSFCWWDGRKTLNNFMPSACVRSYGGSGGVVEDVKYIGVTFHGAFTAIRIAPAFNGTQTVHNCLFDRLYADSIIAPQTELYHASQFTITFNVFKEAWALGSDPQNPHSDSFQAFNDGAFTRPLNYLVAGNITLPGNARGGSASGWLTTDMNLGPAGLSGYWIGNYFLTRQQANAMSLSYTGDAMILNNAIVRWDVDGDISYNENVPQTRFKALHPVLARKNILEGLAVESGIEKTETFDNTNVGFNGTLIDYDNVFTSPGTRPLTRADILTSFATKAPYTLYGPQASNILDWSSLSINWNNVPNFVKFTDVIDQPLNTSTSTRWTRILGGPSTGTISISGTGMTFQIADDDIGTNASVDKTSHSGSVRDKWIKLTCSGISTGLTTNVATLTINSDTFTWRVTSTSTLQYTRVDNGATTYTTMTIPSGQMAADRILIAANFTMDTLPGARFMTGTAGGGTIINFASGGIPKISIGNSGSVLSRQLSGAPATGIRTTWIFLIDLGSSDPVNKFKWMTNVDFGLLASTSNVGIPTTLDMQYFFCGSGSSTMRLWSAGTTGPYMDGNFEMFYADWGRSTDGYQLPDVSTVDARQTLYNKFQRDQINSNGSGPTGSQPFLCFYGETGATDGSEANTWNATGGLTNRGKISTSLIKANGNFTTWAG